MSEHELQHRSYGITVRGINLERRSVDVVASTDTLDAFDEYIDQGSWDIESRFAGNPVCLYNHNRTEGFFTAIQPKDTLPIGHCENTMVRGGKLETTLVFVDEKANPMGELVWQGFIQKSIRAVSVGFKPKNVKAEMREGKEILRLSECCLYEISVCPMGANPDAVAKERAKSLAQLKALAASSAAPSTREATPQENAGMTIDQKTIDTLVADHAKALDAANTKAADAVKVAEKAVADLATATAASAKLTEERDTAITLAKSFETKLKAAADAIIEKDVEALVGKKITPAEREEYVELAKTNKSLFDKMIAKRVDMKLTEQVVPSIKSEASSVAGMSASDQLAELIEKSRPAADTH